MNEVIKPYFETQRGRYYLGDNIELIKQIPDNSIDVVFSDPPFFEHTKHGVGTYEAYRNILEDLYRVTKQDSWLIIYFPSNRLPQLFSDTTNYFTYVDRFIVEFTTTTTKGAFGDKRTIELCIFKKGSPRVVERFSSDVMLGIEDPAFMTLHPKSSLWKPTLPTTLILRKIVGVSERKTLLDPFAGFGSIIYAAEKLGMGWIGMEINPASAEVARKILLDNMEPKEAIPSKRNNKEDKNVKLERWLVS